MSQWTDVEVQAGSPLSSDKPISRGRARAHYLGSLIEEEHPGAPQHHNRQDADPLPGSPPQKAGPKWQGASGPHPPIKGLTEGVNPLSGWIDTRQTVMATARLLSVRAPQNDSRIRW